MLKLSYDPLFQDYMEVTPIDYVVGNVIYMSFENLLPGQMFFYDVSFLTPTVDYIGEFLTSTSRIYGYYEGEQVAYAQNDLTVELTCAYDPNDKQVFPNGYAEPHYVLPETELEYLVRFQNTGNAPATHVIVTDTIDESLDMSTFQLMANSHSVMTTITPDNRSIEFYFENIMLPDSIANEPDSHGMISYKISPYNDLIPETEINNTAFIYFDNNPAIVTNTVWTTIYECTNAIADFTISDEIICLGNSIDFESTSDYVESYDWEIDDIENTESSIFTFTPDELGVYGIMLTASNPLCEAMQYQFFNTTFLEGDANIDGAVNISDILSVSSFFGTSEATLGFGDANNDGVVNVLDILEVSTNFGEVCE